MMTIKDDATAQNIAEARKPYRAPTLRALGSVRELTWGGSPIMTEAPFMGNPMKGM